MLTLLLNALVPIFAGLLLGYVAGRRGLIDNKDIRSLIALAMNIAVPCALVSIIMETPRALLENQATTAIAIALVFIGLYAACYFWARQSLHMSIADSSVLALTIGFPNAAVALHTSASRSPAQFESRSDLLPHSFAKSAPRGSSPGCLGSPGSPRVRGAEPELSELPEGNTTDAGERCRRIRTHSDWRHSVRAALSIRGERSRCLARQTPGATGSGARRDYAPPHEPASDP
jgi:hypothetical protein